MKPGFNLISFTTFHYILSSNCDVLALKRSGFNTVETYVFWNYHEPQEGKGDNTLVVFDETGARIDQTSIQPEKTASRKTISIP